MGEASWSSWRLERDPSGPRTAWFDRPGSSHNSLDSASLEELRQIVAEVAADRSATRLLIRSAKPKGFCAGADLKQIGGFGSPDDVRAFAEYGLETFGSFRKLRVPTIAVIHGACLGGGLELALACTVRVGLADAADGIIALPEASALGLIPGWGAITTLPRLVGLRRALAMLLDGERLDTDEARDAGLLDRVLEEDSLADAVMSTTLGVATTLHAWPPRDWEMTLATVRDKMDPAAPGTSAKRMILRILDLDLRGDAAAAREATARGLGELVFSDQGRTAISAFLSRKPRASPGQAD